MRRRVLFFTMLAVMTAGPLFAQHDHGVVDFETTCSEQVASHINQGVALLHHMMYEQSAEAFQAAADTDANCAMAFWGLAMTQLHPLWAPPTEGEFRKGREAVESARAAGTDDAREKAYIEAIAAFFETEGDFPARLAVWESSQRAVYATYPDDEDAGAFAALSMLAVAPKSDKSFAVQKEAGALTERLHAEHPEHPGFFHYTIHAYDNPALAEQALDVARGYDELAPEVPHALHMPSHIFVRVGDWDGVASWNRRSADAALKHPVGELTSMQYVHAIDYLVYARLQQGRDADAIAAIEELESKGSFQPHIGTAYALAAVPARVALEGRDWAEAAALPVRHPDGFDWESMPAAESITWFTRGIGAARTGDKAAAREAIDRLDGLYEKLQNDAYWRVHTDAHRTAVKAWLAFAEDDGKEAIQLMRAAADIEDSVDKHPITPGAVLPARELLGEMLLLMDRPDEALAAFEASLDISKKRLNSLSGAGRAAELAGNQEKAADYYRQAVALVDDVESVDRPRIADAKRVAGE